MSKYLSRPALRALNRLGDLLIPADGEFPSFSQFGGLEQVDEFVAYVPEADAKDLNLLLTILGFMPTFVLSWLLRKIANASNNNGPAGPIFRQLDTGLRGIIYSCYYSGRAGANYRGRNPLEIIDFELVRVED
jgi:hypothetical protein